MPSPFPGMDPYLEDAEFWGDVYGALCAEMRAMLTRALRPRYNVRLTPHVTWQAVPSDKRATPRLRPAKPVPGERPKPVEGRVPMETSLQLTTLEIVVAGSERLVTAIELLSTVSKEAGHEAQHDYLRRRRAVLRSDAHLLEIDLLRAGERPPLQDAVPYAPYYVTLSRAGRRPQAAVWPVQLWERLPLVPIPLLHPAPDASLDLSEVLAEVYERGGYGPLIDYLSPPPPPRLSEAEIVWVNELLASR